MMGFGFPNHKIERHHLLPTKLILRPQPFHASSKQAGIHCPLPQESFFIHIWCSSPTPIRYLAQYIQHGISNLAVQQQLRIQLS